MDNNDNVYIDYAADKPVITILYYNSERIMKALETLNYLKQRADDEAAALLESVIKDLNPNGKARF
jgi:hypothetical protein